MTIRQAERDDAEAWLQLRRALWPDGFAAHRAAGFADAGLVRCFAKKL